MKSKLLVLNILGCIFSFSFGEGWGEASAQVPTAPGTYQWVKGFGSANQITGQDEIVSAMKFDHAGNIIVCGRVAGYSHIQGLGGKKDSILFNRWQNANNLQGFIAKYDCNGNLLWFKQLQDSINPSEIYDFVVDSSDNIYFFGNSNLGGENIYYDDSLIAPYSFNPPIVGTTILMKINPSGKFNWIWAQPYNVANSIFFQPINQNSNGTVRPNSMVLYHDTINIISPSGSFSSPITINGISIYDGLNLFRFSTIGHLIDAIRLDSINDRLGGYGIDKDGNYIAVINFVYPTNKFLDSTYNRPTASGFNQLSTVIKFNRHHVLRHIEFGDSTESFYGNFSNLQNGFNLIGGGRTGLKIYSNYVLPLKTLLWGANTTSNAALHFEDISSYKWTACPDSSHSLGGFNSISSDGNGDVYSDIAFNEYIRYKTLIAFTAAFGANDFLLKLSRKSGNPMSRQPNFNTTISNSSTNSVRLQNFLINEKGNLFMNGNLSNNSITVGTDTAQYYGGNNDMFIIKYGNPCSNSNSLIAPASPDNLLAKCNGTSIKLTWQDVSMIEDKFYVYRSLNATSGFTKIDSVSANTTQYIDNAVSVTTNYWYTISAHGNAGEGYQSNTDSSRLCGDIGINSVHQQQLVGQLYPNPTTTGAFNLVIQTTEINATAQLQITNYIGQIILNKTVSLKNSNNFKLDVSDYAGGIYLVTLKTEQARYSEKLILVK